MIAIRVWITERNMKRDKKIWKLVNADVFLIPSFQGINQTNAIPTITIISNEPIKAILFQNKMSDGAYKS